MSADPQAKPEAPEAFDSLVQMRAEHVQMMRAVRRGGHDDDFVPRIRAFIDRVKATGKRIDSPTDRDAAQDIIGYWASYLFSASDTETLSAALPLLDTFDPANAADLSARANPYQGLKPFYQGDAAHFVGREEAVKTLLEKLRDYPAVLVSGPMGSGKTSLVTAGVIPRLKSRLVAENKDPVVLFVLPGTAPFAALLGTIHETAADPGLPKVGDFISAQTKELERFPDRLHALLEGIFPGRPVILVVDQFEQLFTRCADPKIREQFARAVCAVASDPQAPNRLVLLVHERYRAQALHLAALELLAQTPGALFSPPPLTGQEVRRMIENSAATVGLKFDEGIIEDLVNEVQGDPGALPTLQFTLSKLWNERNRDRITWDAYQKVGRPREALNRTAEAIFNDLTPDEQRVSKKIFLALVSPTIEEDFVLRRIRRDDLMQLDVPETVSRVLGRYVEAGLIRHIPSTHWDDDHFDIIHEALIHHWPRLGEWLRKERGESEQRLRLLSTARLWQESGFKSDFLLSGDALEAAAAYTEDAPELKEFVTASRKEVQRSARRLVRIQSAVIAIMAALLLAAVWGWLKAGKEAEIAQQNAARAQQNATTAFATVRSMLDAVKIEADRGGISVEMTKKVLEPAAAILQSIELRPELFPARIDLLNAFSDAYSTAGDNNKALDYAQQAKELAEKLIQTSPGNEDWQLLLYQSAFRVGDAYANVRGPEAQKALPEYQIALKSAELRAAKGPDDSVRLEDVAFIDNKIGDIYMQKKEFQQSLDWYLKGLAIADQLLAKGAGNPDGQKVAANARMRIGDLYADQPDRLREAFSQYEAALQIRESLRNSEPDNDSYQSNLSTSYFRLGDLYKKDRKFADALTRYQAAFAISSPLAQKDSGNVESQVRLARLYAAIADTHVNLREIDEALEEYDGALQIRIRLAQQFPRSRDRALDLAVVYERIGDTWQEKHTAANSENALPNAISAYRMGLAVTEPFMGANADSRLQARRDRLQIKLRSLTPNAQ